MSESESQQNDPKDKMTGVVDRRNTSACPVCGYLKERNQLACKTHWFQLSKELRDKIWSAYRRQNWTEWKSLYAEALKVWRVEQ